MAAAYDPLIDACERGNVDAVKLLLSHPATSERSCLPALFAAIRSGCEVCVELLLDKGVDVNGAFNIETALFVACEENQFEIALQLLSRGAKLIVVEKLAKNNLLQKVIHDNLIVEQSTYVQKKVVRVLDAILRTEARLAEIFKEIDILTLCRHLFYHGHCELAMSLVFNKRVSKAFREYSFALYYCAKNNCSKSVIFLLDEGIPIDGVTDSLSAKRISIFDDDILTNKDKDPLAYLDLATQDIILLDDGIPIPIDGVTDSLSAKRILIFDDDILTNEDKDPLAYLDLATRDIILFDKGIPIHEGINPLTKVIDPLVRHGIESPLVGASESGHADIVSILIERGAALNSRRRYIDRNPLLVAASVGSLEVVSMLVKAGANVNETQYECNNNHDNLEWPDESDLSRHWVVRSKLVSGSDWYTKGPLPYTALHAACARRRVDVVALLIASKSDKDVADKWRYTPLHVAAERGFDDVVKLLLAVGHNVNARTIFGETPLNLLCASLLGGPIGTVDRNLFGSNESFVTSVKLLSNNGANVNLPNASGDTPLCNACVSNRLDIVEILLDAGANVNYFTRRGCPLWTACEKSNADLVRLLLGRGAEPNTTSTMLELTNQPFNCLVPLCIAAASSDIDVIKLLLTAGASVSSVDGMRKTALHYAVGPTKRIHASEAKQLERRLPVVALLLAHGGNVNTRDARCETPIAIAVSGLRIAQLRIYSNALEEEYFIKNRVRMDVATFRRLILPVVTNFVRVQVDVIRLLVDNGAILDDAHCPHEGQCTLSSLSVTTIGASRPSVLYPFLTCSPIDVVLVEIFLKSCASLKWLSWVRDSKRTSANSIEVRPELNNRSEKPSSSLQLCKAILFAGYVTSRCASALYSSGQVNVTKQTNKDKDRKKSPNEETIEAWTKKDDKEIPSLMRLCRLAIRRHLSEVNEHRSIANDVWELPLPEELVGYVGFEGPLSDATIDVPDLYDETVMLNLLHLHAN